MKIKRYNISLRIKEGQDKQLPYSITTLRVSIMADSFVEACEKAEVYFSGALGISMVTDGGYEEYHEDDEDDVKED